MAQSWVFQGNPNRFDIDGFFATRPAQTSWLVTRYADRITPGDQVFIWRAIGDGDEADSGIIAEARVLQGAEPKRDDPAAREFWKNPSEADEIANRAELGIVRIATTREVIRRNWLREDPVLRNLLVLRMRNASNYEVSPDQAIRLNALWLKTGHDWSYAEAVAGLWAYQQTYGREVSRLPGSPVSTVALLTGRAVSGVYIKVVNYRSIDPRDARAGMSGASDTDRKVWEEFYDPKTSSLRSEPLEAEFQRLWGSAARGSLLDEAQSADANVEQETRRLIQMNLPELMVIYQTGTINLDTKPKAKAVYSRAYERSPVVAAIARVRAGFRCEVPACVYPTFVTTEGVEYCEVHHVRPLAEGGRDEPENVACLCPSHHREAHHGRFAAELREALALLRGSPPEHAEN